MANDASTALLTDHYELTMLQAALRSGTAERASVFELFGRRLPGGRRYGVVGGVGRALDAIESFRFDEPTLAFLCDSGVVDETTAHRLSTWSFTGDVWGYAEGEIYFPYSPLLVVESSFAEAVLLETVLLSIYNYDSAIASAASRMTWAAGDRPCVEMGSRRAHEHAAIASARAAYICGFTGTSNLEAGRRHGIPTMGTAAHSFTLLHETERDAFTAQVEALGAGTTLLVDTYDVNDAVRTAIEVAGPGLGAVRIDSGDLGETARQVRRQLDSLGASETRILVTSDLDEHAIAALAAAPVDGYGVGTSLVTGSGHPTSGLVYKLVARADADGKQVPVAKLSKDKGTTGGRKYALRRRDSHGVAEAEVIGVGRPPQDDGDPSTGLRTSDRELLVPLVRQGTVVAREPVEDARERHRAVRDELPGQARSLTKGDPVIPTVRLGT